MQRTLCDRLAVGSLLVVPIMAATSWAASPSAEQALQLVPIQRNVDYDRPDTAEAPRCAIAARKFGSHVGWVVSDPAGLTLRKFVDTNGDNVVDQWSYYRNGLEVYRDIDADFNGKADQYRWFHTAGCRWGLDKNEDGAIDAWKVISAEEVTAEVVAAIANQDVQRFARVALTAEELPTLGLGSTKAAELAEKLAGLEKGFQQMAARQKEITRNTQWIQFSGTRPGIVPANTDGSTRDLRVYENVMAIVETGENDGQVLIGTLVEMGEVWRVIDVPQPISSGETQLGGVGFFFRGETPDHGQVATAGPSEQVQSLLSELEKLDAAADRATSREEQARYNARRADLLEQIAQQAGSREDRAMWVRQLADVVSAAVQSGGYPGGAKRLNALLATLEKSPSDRPLAAYVKFRQMTAEYGEAIQTASTSDFVKIQEAWLDKLEQYAGDYPDSPDAAEAMLQLGIAQEFAGEEQEAKKWLGRVVAEFPNSPQAVKAAGARTRLDSVGKQISLRGQGPMGNVVDLASFRGKVVLIQYWATWCGPCKADMASLKELLAKFGVSGFNIIGVNLDTNPQEMADYLAENPLPWPQIREEGGLDSRPANEMGILTLPTMILVDQQGKVVNRNVQVVDLEGELKKLLR